MQVDLAAQRVERRDRDRAQRGVERAAAQQADAVGGVVDLAQPRADRDGDDPVLAPVRAHQRGEARVARCDVPELAPDQEAQLVVLEVLDVLRRDDDRIGVADSDRHDRDERVVAHEHVRRRHAQHPRALLDGRVHVRELAGVDAQPAAEQPAAGERDVHHRDHDDQRQLLPRELVLEDPAQQRDRDDQRAQRQHEGRALAADPERLLSAEERRHDASSTSA